MTESDAINLFPFLSKDAKRGAASMPVARDSDCYNMTHPKRGKAVIFSHRNFIRKDPRSGCNIDVKNLKVCLALYGFEIIVHKDLPLREFKEVLEKLRKEDHSERDCLLIVVMSHGGRNKIYCSDSYYKPEVLWNSFTADCCPTLAGKPKIFLIQACSGYQVDAGTMLTDRTHHDTPLQDDMSYVIPNCADFLIVFSTAPGYLSYKHTEDGCWFVQALKKVMKSAKDKEDGKKEDLLSLMTAVAREVALNFESDNLLPRFNERKQVPMINSTLIRKVYL